MIRLLLFFVALALLAYGGMWLVQHPGHVSLDWFGYQIETSAALLILAVAVVAIVAWVILRIIVGLPSFVRLASRQRRREKGYAALSRGLVAVGSGDARAASRASVKATQHLKDDTLALMLEAQAAHLNGNGAAAVRAFEALAQREETRILGLRGLYAEASRRGDDEAARHFAAAAYKASPLPWSAQATLEHRAHAGDWESALASVEASVSAGHVDKDTGDRQRAVLETAIALDKEGTAPEAALALARAAMKRAPDLAPPVVLAARLLSRRGDIRKAAKLVERAWPQCRHPDIAQAYLEVRPGDSTTDRLSRAKTLMGIANFDPVSRMLVARAALANTDYAAARSAMAPLVAEGQRPTVRMCLLMAEIEEAEFGDIGQWREWLARASRATLDPAWVADGTVYDSWGPVSPTTGKLDAFRWQVPADRLGPAVEALPATAPGRTRGPALTGSSAAALPGAGPTVLAAPADGAGAGRGESQAIDASVSAGQIGNGQEPPIPAAPQSPDVAAPATVATIAEDGGQLDAPDASAGKPDVPASAPNGASGPGLESAAETPPVEAPPRRRAGLFTSG